MTLFPAFVEIYNLQFGLDIPIPVLPVIYAVLFNKVVPLTFNAYEPGVVFIPIPLEFITHVVVESLVNDIEPPPL